MVAYPGCLRLESPTSWFDGKTNCYTKFPEMGWNKCCLLITIFQKEGFLGYPKTMDFNTKMVIHDMADWKLPYDLGTPPQMALEQAMRCLASMETVGQCYASTIAGELASQDPESRAAACDLVVMSWISPFSGEFSVRNFGGCIGLIGLIGSRWPVTNVNPGWD